jgi:hypothetical protein
MESVNKQNNYRSAVQMYHSLPLVTVVTMVTIFMGVWYLTGNYIASGLAAGIPAIALIGLWIRAAKRVDRWVCAQCGQPFPKKMLWRYPPNKCPNCGVPSGS